jgi:hypothetical protein
LQFESAALAAAVAPALANQDQEMDDEGRMTTSGFFLGVVGMLAGAAVGSGWAMRSVEMTA